MYFLDKKTSQKDSDAFRLLIDIGELISLCLKFLNFSLSDFSLSLCLFLFV